MAKKTATRLSLIAKGQNIIKSTFKEGKIKRAIESALANAEENALDEEEKVLEVLEKFSTSEDFNEVINSYVKHADSAEAWRNTKKHLEQLKAKLAEEVDVEE